MSKNAVIGIDLGGTRTKVGIITQDGSLKNFTEFNTNAQKPFDDFFEILINKIQTIKKTEFPIVGIGVGAPNANYQTGKMEKPHNFNWGVRVPLAQALKNQFNLPVVITNDANAAAIGEYKYGVAQGIDNFIILTLGTGLGGGIIINGELLHGSHGLAGEIGHVSVKPNGRSCKCGLNACFESYVSVTGVKRTVFKFIGEWAMDSPLRQFSFSEMTGEIIADAALDGDPIAIHAFQYTGDILGRKLADMVAYFDPEAFVLAGGLTKAGEILLGPTRESLNKHVFSAYRGKHKVLVSKMLGKDAVRGAAALIWKQLEGKEKRTEI